MSTLFLVLTVMIAIYSFALNMKDISIAPQARERVERFRLEVQNGSENVCNVPDDVIRDEIIYFKQFAPNSFAKHRSRRQFGVEGRRDA